MKFWFPLGLVFATGLSALQALPPAAQSTPPSQSSPSPPTSVVPPPRPAPQLPPPPIPPRAQLTFPRTALERQRVTPAIEVWRAGAHSPQAPTRRGNYMAPALIADNQPVMVR